MPEVPLRTSQELPKTLPSVSGRPLIKGLDVRGLKETIARSLKEGEPKERSAAPVLLPPEIAAREEAAKAAGFSLERPFTSRSEVQRGAVERAAGAVDTNVRVLKNAEMQLVVEDEKSAFEELRERRDAMANAIIARNGGDPRSMDLSASRHEMRDIERQIGETVQDALSKANILIDPNEDLTTMHLRVSNLLAGAINSKRRFAADLSAQDAANYFIDRAYKRAAGDISLSSTPETWEWKEKDPLSDLSDFQRAVLEIDRILKIPIATRTPENVANLVEAVRLRNEILVEANNERLFDTLKASHERTLESSRVNIPLSQKPRVKQELLRSRQEAEQQPYESRGFWDAPERAGLRHRMGGAVDYFNTGSLDLSLAHMTNPRAPLPDNGLNAVWDYEWTDDRGRRRVAVNFNELRAHVERIRREGQRYVPSSNYLLPIEFIADDLLELGEAVEDTLIRFETEALAGDTQTVAGALQEKQGYGRKAMDAFLRETGYKPEHPIIMHLTTKLNSVAYLLGASVFIDAGSEGYKSYLNYMKVWGAGFRTEDVVGKETNHSYLDVLYFDQDGFTPLALDRLMENQGEYWRFGSTTEQTPSEGQRKRYQKQWEHDTVELMATQELRPIDELLDTHPVFIALKAKMDARDPTLWPEYQGQAQAWERFAKGDSIEDERDPDARIQFEHPLARALTRAEFSQMYRPLQRLPNESDEHLAFRMEDRRNRAKIVLKRAERLATVLLVDSAATSARLILKKEDIDPATGSPRLDSRGEPRMVSIGEVKPFETIVREQLDKVVADDARYPLDERRFKVFHVLKKLKLVDFPTYAAFDVGADDTLRDQLVKYFLAEPELRRIIDIKDRMDPEYVGPNAKTVIVRWVEDERRVITLLERAIRKCKKIETKDSRGNTVYADGTDYYNYPGYGTPGAGVKSVKNNALYPYYGISRDTLRNGYNGLIPAAYYGVKDVLREYGCEDFLRFIAWEKRADELDLADEGPAFHATRGMPLWVGRLEGVQGEQTAFTSKGEKDGKAGLLIKPITGAPRVRSFNRTVANFGSHPNVNPIEKPFGHGSAFDMMTDDAHTRYLGMIGEVYGPMYAAMRSRAGIENSYGTAADTAKFMNTLLVYDFFDWMDYMPEESRGQFGFAVDAMLSMPRHAVNTDWQEEGLIYSPAAWKKMMEDDGLIDLIPEELRKKVRIGQGGFEIDPIPLDPSGGRRWYPAHLDLTARYISWDEAQKYMKAPMLSRSARPLMSRREEYDDQQRH